MDAQSRSTPFGPTYSPKIVTAIGSCTAAIARLDAHVCVSSVAKGWGRRAAWSGYAQALQLQSAELDEIDVFSWGCGLQIPGRPLRSTTMDMFDRFDEWVAALHDTDTHAWRDSLPSALCEPHGAQDHPPLIRALEQVRQHARIDGTALPWLSLPLAIRDKRMSAGPLPCLVGGAKAFRLRRTLADEDWLGILRSVEVGVTTGLARLHELERLYREAQRAIVAEYRPGALSALCALTHHRPLLSPQSVANLLNMSVAGASKLLRRGVDCGLLTEITERRSWRLFLATDLAIEFGYVRRKRGRPPRELPPLPSSRGVTAILDEFDQQMIEIDRLLLKQSK